MKKYSPVIQITRKSFDENYFSSGGYDTYEKDVAGWVPGAARRMRALLKDIHNPSVLDVGCARGYLLAALQNKYGMCVRGLEYSDYALRTAEPSVRRRIRRGNILESGAFPVNSFDLVVCLDVFGHIDFAGTKRAAKNLLRWTRRYVVFSALYRHSSQASQEINPDPFRITTLSQKEYRNIFQSAGARTIKKINFGNGGDVFFFEKVKK